MSKNVLGISAYYHDSAACLVRDGVIIAAAQEERFSRKKHDSAFPVHALRYCLSAGQISLADLAAITFYDKPLLKFERLLETYVAYAPAGFISFLAAMPVWIKDKLFLKSILKKELAALGDIPTTALPRLLFTEHHQAHAASAFYPSPFTEAAVLCVDGVGEWATTSCWLGKDKSLTPLWELHFPHSLGMLYSAFTYFTGFKVNSGEYKLMGLAPYGEPKYVALILDKLIDVKSDGSFRLNMDYFSFASGLTMTNKKFARLFGGPARAGEEKITQREMDLARSIQGVTEEILLKLVRTIHAETNQQNLCLAGGVALNCVANGRIQREGPFKNIWIQPAAGDAGGALGAALLTTHEYFDMTRQVLSPDAMQGSYLGPSPGSDDMIEQYLNSVTAPFEKLAPAELCARVAQYLAEGSVIGWVQGRMEFGPRALGGRSILGDPRNREMQTLMNLKIKYRESFRPFAPAILEEKVGEVFAIDRPSPYMLLVAPVQENRRLPMTTAEAELFGIEKLIIPRSDVPAITHVDYSARIQTVSRETNPKFYQLIEKFYQATGCPLLVNTSFNVRGEPIVASVQDAYRCFMRTEMDYLVVEDFLLSKAQQPNQKIWKTNEAWKNEFALD